MNIIEYFEEIRRRVKYEEIARDSNLCLQFFRVKNDSWYRNYDDIKTGLFKNNCHWSGVSRLARSHLSSLFIIEHHLWNP